MNIIPGVTRLRPKCTSLRITMSNMVNLVFAIWPFVIILRTKGIERSDVVIEMKRVERNRDHCDCIYIITSSAIYLQTILYFYFTMHFNFVQQFKSVIFCKSHLKPLFRHPQLTVQCISKRRMLHLVGETIQVYMIVKTKLTTAMEVIHT